MGVLWELELQIFEGRARKVMGACFYFFTWKWKVLFLSLHIYAHVLQIFSVLKTFFCMHWYQFTFFFMSSLHKWEKLNFLKFSVYWYYYAAVRRYFEL